MKTVSLIIILFIVIKIPAPWDMLKSLQRLVVICHPKAGR